MDKLHPPYFIQIFFMMWVHSSLQRVFMTLINYSFVFFLILVVSH